MDIERAKELFKMRIETEEYSGMTTNTLKEAMTTVLAELEKKDKVINEMAECIGQDLRCVRPEIECNKMTHDCRECVKEYYFNKVEREGK